MMTFATDLRRWLPWMVVIWSFLTGLIVLAGILEPLRPVVVLIFYVTCPGLAIVRLLRLRDLLVEVVLMFALSLVVDSVVAMLLLYTGAWSYVTGLLMVIGISLLGILLDMRPSGLQMILPEISASRLAAILQRGKQNTSFKALRDIGDGLAAHLRSAESEPPLPAARIVQGLPRSSKGLLAEDPVPLPVPLPIESRIALMDPAWRENQPAPPVTPGPESRVALVAPVARENSTARLAQPSPRWRGQLALPAPKPSREETSAAGAEQKQEKKVAPRARVGKKATTAKRTIAITTRPHKKPTGTDNDIPAEASHSGAESYQAPRMYFREPEPLEGQPPLRKRRAKAAKKSRP